MQVLRNRCLSPLRKASRAVITLAVLLAAQLAFAFEPFVVRDIRIEGAQRTEPGTIFGYLPVKVGETMTDEKAAQAVRALYSSGFFKDVKLEVEGNVLVVFLEERPAIASVSITGTKEIDGDTIKRAMRDQGLGEGRIFDRSVLERAEQELKRQYLNRGKYSASVTSTVTPLERNRVAITMAVAEGETATIKSISIIGNQAFTEKQILDEFKLSTPTWMSWYTKTDQYAREKFSGDLEALRSFYLNRGYLEFGIESTQVSISPNKEDIQLTVAVKEGGIYRVSGIDFSGKLLGREQEFSSLMKIQVGETFSGQKLSDSTKAIIERLGSLGYAFANVNPVPKIDRNKREVKFEILVDPGRRVYVRRIEITGNARTRDEVIRRELRQFEDAWYDADKIRLSRERVARLGFFTDVRIDNAPVPNAVDQVDLNLSVVEQPTGAISFGLGLSSYEKVIISAGLNQQNFLGTGKSLGLNVNTSKLNRTISLSYTDPYFTASGISRSFDLYTRTFDAAQLNLGDYRWRSNGVGLRFGLPYTEVDRITFGLGVENNQLRLGPAAPERYKEYVADFGEDSTSLVASASWRRDTRDSAYSPTRGQVQTAAIDVTLPVLDLNYYRTTYNHQWYYPISRDFTLALNGDFGIGRGFGGNDYPLFKHFYAGGIGSVRGYYQASLGPRDPVDNVAIGGNTKILGSAEFIFPLPGTGNDRSIRTFVFFDAGNVYSTNTFSLSDLRYSTGLGVNWASPIGPLKLSLGFPLNSEANDRLQRVQFQIGTGF
jgi:outer membrane protein insertion porin family